MASDASAQSASAGVAPDIFDPSLVRLLNDDDDAAIHYEASKQELFRAADRKLMTERRLERHLQRHRVGRHDGSAR